MTVTAMNTRSLLSAIGDAGYIRSLADPARGRVLRQKASIVMLALAIHGNQTNPPTAEIAAWCAFDEPTVLQALAILTERGYINADRQVVIQ